MRKPPTEEQKPPPTEERKPPPTEERKPPVVQEKAAASLDDAGMMCHVENDLLSNICKCHELFLHETSKCLVSFPFLVYSIYICVILVTSLLCNYCIQYVS